MKKLFTLAAIAALAFAFAPEALACGKHAVQTASATEAETVKAEAKTGCGAKDAHAVKTVEGKKACGLKGAAGEKDSDCLKARLACIEKMTATDKDGNLVCEKSNTVFAKAVKSGDKTEYQVGEKTYACRFEAARAAFAANFPDMPSPFDEASLPKDEKGNLYCKCCDKVVAVAKKSSSGAVTYAVGKKEFDCPFKAAMAAIQDCCGDGCGGKDAAKAKGDKKARGAKKACGATT